MIRVDIKPIREALLALDMFNAIPFEELELVENGELISIPPKAREEWKFVGLCNSSFVELEGWNGWEPCA